MLAYNSNNSHLCGLGGVFEEVTGITDVNSYLQGNATILAIVGVAFVAFMFFGPAANERNKQLRSERDRHNKAVADIRSKYGRLGYRGPRGKVKGELA